MENINKLLIDYINEPNNAETNWALAVWYHSIGQTATALSYYLRAAERTNGDLLKYECLIRAAECFDSQGTRKLTVKGLLQHAIAIQPNRPEGYWCLSKLYESEQYGRGRWFDAYLSASLGLQYADENLEPLREYKAYPGKYALLFQKAHSGWQCGLCDDARDIFIDLYENYKMDEVHLTATKNNLDFLSTSYQNLHRVYDSESKENFKWGNTFDWGIAARNEWFKNTVEKEIFEQNVYEKFKEVKNGDVVLDIGASAGPFTYSIKDKNPSKVICIEPHPSLFKTLQKNTSEMEFVTCVNKAIGSIDGFEEQFGLFNPDLIETAEDENKETLETIRFNTLLKENDVEFIDFIKIDCEGGEYDIFTDENINWFEKNVRYVAGEWHLSNQVFKDKFRKFRDTYLKRFDFKIYSCDEVDITDTVWDEWFIEYYKTISLYIDNSHAVKKENLIPINVIPNKHQYSIAPTLEITTVIPEKGCVVDCVFCPQRTLTNVYKGERRLTLENFKKAIDKVPTEVRITFAGFVEPWLNSSCTDMILYAHEKGHPISVFTTLVGVSIEDLERIKHIPFAGAPNGHFTVHLPDQERRAKHPINKKYIETVEHLGKIKDQIHNFTIMSMGQVHEDVRHVFPTAPVYDMWSRAGNLIGEAQLKPELQKEHFKTIDHGDKDMTCGCDERLYHNIMLPNGDISLCCMDYGLEEITGNIFEQDYNDVIPDPYSTYDMCRRCENAIDVNSLFIQAERKVYNV